LSPGFAAFKVLVVCFVFNRLLQPKNRAGIRHDVSFPELNLI